VPDFRIRSRAEDPTWTYVEVTQAETSDAYRAVEETMARIAALTDEIGGSFALEVFLFREPRGEEIEPLRDHIRRFIAGGMEPRRAELADGLGLLILNECSPGQVVPATIVDDEQQPRIGIAQFRIEANLRRHVVVRAPFVDARVEEFVTREARQLSRNAPGLIMIGIDAAVGASTSWGPAIQRRFQPALHTRISGVCLLGGGLVSTEAGEAALDETHLLINPHARNPLPEWIGRSLIAAGDEYRSVLSRRVPTG
jgi:hypothetical protein